MEHHILKQKVDSLGDLVQSNEDKRVSFGVYVYVIKWTKGICMIYTP